MPYRLELLDYIPCTGCIIVIALPDLLPAPNGSVFFLDVATIFLPFKCLCACNKKERKEEEHKNSWSHCLITMSTRHQLLLTS